MLKIISSLSFLYCLSIIVLVVYALVFYRGFAKAGRQPRFFPVVFGIIALSCLGFLWINFHAPLSLKTISNTDHHFLRHSGFLVNEELELGTADTANFPTAPYNSFKFSRDEAGVSVTSSYSEEPFYASTGGVFTILSSTYPALNEQLCFSVDGQNICVTTTSENDFELTVNDQRFSINREIRKGISIWNLFKDELAFINTVAYRNEQVILSLNNLYVVRNDVSRRKSGELRYFISSKLFTLGNDVNYGGRNLTMNDARFVALIDDQSQFAWGISFLDNNRNQYKLSIQGADSFIVHNKYPVSYPLSGEKRDDWSVHPINKFLVSDHQDMLRIPAVFRQGFLFPGFAANSETNFRPILLNYERNTANVPLKVQARIMDEPGSLVQINNSQLVLPAGSKEFSWLFTIENTFTWQFGGSSFTASAWKALLLGSLLFFILMVLANSFATQGHKLNWVWQVLACITLLLLTTRYFFYWRYKSFPPYEGMDLPSLQQLNSFWNFGIILLATFCLSIVFGYGLLSRVIKGIAGKSGKRTVSLSVKGWNKIPGFYKSRVQRLGARNTFLLLWLLTLLISAGAAFASGFNPGICRHLAIGLVIAYFIFSLYSYRYSPLVVGQEKSWWTINTSKISEVLFNNPMKVLISLSLLALLVFIDIGFGIVFLNFLLFNETFLCINYSISGLSPGSRKNATIFGVMGMIYLAAFLANLLYAPYIFNFFLDAHEGIFLSLYLLGAFLIMINIARFLSPSLSKQKPLVILSGVILLFAVSFFFFPKEKILAKAAMTKYRIDVMTMPVDQAIEAAYEEGKTWQPVIRAAQNQWFINTFIEKKNNPAAGDPGFHLLPHAPQTKGAKYNAQATDLVASRFFLAEHGAMSVILFVLLLLLPVSLLASFYKLYPDFSNRINTGYPLIATGFSILNYLLITALLVILAATGRYIFFGQDLPFASILSKQSVLFPSLLIILVVIMFRKIPLEYYANRKKLLPGGVVFILLVILLFFFQPTYNREKEFNVPELAGKLEAEVQLHLQPVLDFFDTSRSTRNLSFAAKDKLFTDSLRQMQELSSGKSMFAQEIIAYGKADFARHLDQSRMLYLDLYSGRPKLTVNENYFRIEPPPHLQESWTGNLYSDSSRYNINLWTPSTGELAKLRLSGMTNEPVTNLGQALTAKFSEKNKHGFYQSLYLVNNSNVPVTIESCCENKLLVAGDSLRLYNPWQATIKKAGSPESMLIIEPDAFMKNYFVNGSRFYVYPLENRFIWARNFAESASVDFNESGKKDQNATVSIDFELMDSLTAGIKSMMTHDSEYERGAEYGIAVADGNGRLIGIADYIKGISRPDPNDKAGFNRAIRGEEGFVSQSLLRKQIGNINLLRMNPGPGSTLKPVIFSAIASQLNVDWDNFSAQGFTGEQDYFGGEKVKAYDFELNNGNITSVADFIKYSDNYYYANLLLLGSYPKQDLNALLESRFQSSHPSSGVHWPTFNYKGKQFWLDGFENWPGFINGKVNFGLENSFTSISLLENFGIFTRPVNRTYDLFSTKYDSSLFMNAQRRSGFILAEYSIFDQYGSGVNHKIPYDVFAGCFRGHVKGSSQVLVPPVKMLESFGRLVSQSRDYTITLNPYASAPAYRPFEVDAAIPYNNYLTLIKEGVFGGMEQVLDGGTASRLGAMLKKNSPYFYYAKTGTTGDNEAKTKSKLLAITISKKDISHPDFNFRHNKFYTIYFTLQNGPAKQNEEFISRVIKTIENSESFQKYFNDQQ